MCVIVCAPIFQLYRPLNIYISLVGVEVWADGDKIQIVENADKTMNNFLDYRRHYISPKYHNDNAQLILWVVGGIITVDR